MADSSALCCYGSGFDVRYRICVNHLREAYEHALSIKDVEMCAAIIWKQNQAALAKDFK